MTFTLFLAFAAFFISLAGTRLLILAFRNNPILLDNPNQRSNHSKPVPRGAGLAVIFALLIPMLVADMELYFVIPILLLVAISFIDDLLGVPVWIRFMVQLLAVSIPLVLLPSPLISADIPPILEKIFVGFCWLWIINLFNFMDGIDGMSAVELIAVGLGIALLYAFIDLFPNQTAHYGMITAAAACGFWWWNRSPARIFLGDVGSIPLGLMLGFLLSQLVMQGYWAAAIILPAYYFSDCTITLFQRLYNRKAVWVAHSEHYYQRAARRGWRHNVVVRYVAGVNISLGFLAIYSAIEPDLNIFFIALAYMATFMVMGFFAHETKPSIVHDTH